MVTNNIKAYIKCPDCGDVAELDMSVVWSSYPPQYSWYCPHCHSSGFISCDDTKLVDPVIFKKTGARYMVYCKICGNEIPVYGDENPIICKECKEAIIAMRRTLGTWNE